MIARLSFLMALFLAGCGTKAAFVYCSGDVLIYPDDMEISEYERHEDGNQE